MKRGFTLAEVMVASVIILVVLGALAFALLFFFRGSRSLELQDGALTLARVEFADMERTERFPEPGVTERADSMWGNSYTVQTSVNSYSANTYDVTVAVTSGDSVSIELSRRFYQHD
jgi:prepilin-type N-terminal cleavage/methylation domain-containing protein